MTAAAARRRRAVIAAAIGVFADRGYSASSATIAQRAGMSDAYLYRLFGTKRALFLACHTTVAQRVRSVLEQAARAPGPPDERLSRMLGAYGTTLTADERRLQVHVHAAADPVIRAAARAGHYATLEHIARVSGADVTSSRSFYAELLLLNVLDLLNPAPDPMTQETPMSAPSHSDTARIALVTGASRGIGRAIALALAADGAAVAVNYRRGRAEAEAVVGEIEAAGGRAIAIGADVADHAQARAMVEQVLEELGGLHVLVNNAGIARDGLLYRMRPEDWLDVMRVNFGGTFNCTQAAMGHLMAQRDGAIVNVSSVMGERGWTGESNYAASKAAINAFTRCSAVELARFGVRVNAVLPGFAPTELVAGLLARDGGKGVKRQIPMREFAPVEDVARTVAFLASDAAAYMTGSLLTVDGGAAAVLGVGAPL